MAEFDPYGTAATPSPYIAQGVAASTYPTQQKPHNVSSNPGVQTTTVYRNHKMAYLVSVYLLVGTIALVIVRVYSQTLSKRSRFRQFCEDNGCSEPPMLPNRLPAGVEHLWQLLFNPNCDILDDFLAPKFRELGNAFAFGSIFKEKGILVADPECFRTCFSLNFDDFETGIVRRGPFYPVMGDGIFTADGHQWEHFKSQMRPMFVRNETNDLEALQRHFGKMVRAMPMDGASDYTEELDLQTLIHRFVLDMTTELLFGDSIDSQSLAHNTSVKSRVIDLGEAIDVCSTYMGLRLIVPRFNMVLTSPRFRRACNTISRFASNSISSAVAAKEDEPKMKNKSLLGSLLEATQDPKELRDQLVQSLFAGRGPTAALISWIYVLLCRHPEVSVKLRQEVYYTFGRDPDNAITFSQLKSCMYLNAVVSETLRLYPPVPLTSRVAIKDTVLPTGGGSDGTMPMAVSRGQSLIFSTYQLHRREDIWGQDASKWKPERHLSRKIEWEFVPFGGGKRNCPGRESLSFLYAVTTFC